MSDTIELELERWMVEQLREYAQVGKHEARTEKGKQNAQQIVEELTGYLEDHEANDEYCPD